MTKYKEFSSIYVTKDYSLFKSMDGNRDLNPLHLKRIKNSMEKKALMSVITVNEKMEVVDGQHSLSAREELALPVYFIICEGYTREDINILNANRLNWSPDDFMNAYADLGYKDYIQFREFKEQFGFPYQICTLLLGKEANGRGNGKQFAEGTFKVERYGEAIKIANRIHEIKEFYDGWKRRDFIRAMIKLIRNSVYVHEEFVEKLSMQRTKLVDCTCTEDYMKILEDIYNWKRQNKVRLF